MGTTFVVISVENNPPKSSKMKSMLLVALFVAVAAAYPQELTVEYKEPIAITKYGSVSDETGKYSYNFEAANGIKLNEEGEQKRFGNELEEVGSIARGSYSYELEGVTYTVNWLLMRTDSSPLVLTCPLLPPCPSTSSRCWLT